MNREQSKNGLFLLGVIVVVLVGAGLLIASYVRTDVIADIAAEGRQISMLVLIELPEGRLTSEVVIFDTATSRAALFDVPSNTGVVVASLNRVDGIDTVYRSDGIESYRAAVADLLGTPVDFFIAMDARGLETVTDLLEGIPMFVADVPNEGPDAVRIPTGDVVLDGAKIQTYLGYAPEGERDRERIARAQKAVVGLLHQLGQQRDLVANRSVLALISGAIETNLDRDAIVSLATALHGLEVDRVITRQVEGTVRNVDTGEASEELLFPHQEGRWLVESVRQVVENLQSPEALLDENIVIRLEILNGTETTGLARRTAELYRSYGFDVVTVGNAASTDVKETLVLDRVGNEIFADRTAEIIRATTIEQRAAVQAGVDVTVILGGDFDGRYVR